MSKLTIAVADISNDYANVLAKIGTIVKNYHSYMERSQFRLAAISFASYLGKLGKKVVGQHWKQTDPKKSIYMALHIVKIFQILATPFLPVISAQIREQFNLNEDYFMLSDVEKLNLPAGHPILQPVRVYFTKKNST
jgi:methionyl-tRNA synthetase